MAEADLRFTALILPPFLQLPYLEDILSKH